MTVTKMGRCESAKMIREAMESRGATGPEVASEIGCGTQSVYNWRDGVFAPSHWAIAPLAKALRLSESRLRRAAEADRAHRQKHTASGDS
jgi:hypothetical protein